MYIILNTTNIKNMQVVQISIFFDNFLLKNHLNCTLESAVATSEDVSK